MKHITKLFTRLATIAALGFLTAAAAWGQNTHTIGWGAATGDAGTYTNFSATSGTVTNVLSFSTAKNNSSNAPAYNASNNELRLYYHSGGDGGSITITPATGITITGAVMTTSTAPSVKYSVDGGTATSVSASNNTYTISGITASSSLKIQNVNTSNTQLRIKTIAITYSVSADPSINADDISIDADATSGLISYIINNGTSGAVVTAQVLNGSTIANLSFGTITSTTVPFTCEANTTSSERSATVRLAYGDVTKDVTITQARYVPVVPGYVVDFENEAGAYTDWIFTNMESQKTNDNVSAHGGSYFGDTGGKATASITTKARIATPYTLTCYVTKQSGNTTASEWKIQVSSDGNSWTDVATQSAINMSAGTWVEFSANLTAYTNVYVRVSYGSNTAVRNIDDLTLVTEIPSSPIINATAPTELAYNATSGSISYEIANYEAGTMTATSTATWISGFTTSQNNENGEVSFTTTENNTAVSRSATVTLTYTYGNSQSSTAEVTVSQAGNPNAPGTQNNPYTVAQAIENIPASGTSANVYIHGIVSEFYNTSIVGDGSNYRYNISDDGTTTGQLLVFKGKGLNQTAFSDINDLLVGDEVTIFGGLTKYNNTNEVAANNYIVSLNRPPQFVAENVIIDHDVTSGSIAYTISNSVEGGVVSAATTSDWLTLGTSYASPIAFTCQANASSSPRTATVTLTYTYGDKTSVKEVTVTQLGGFANISDIDAINTEYSVRGTVVAINSRGFIIGDGTGYVYYYKNAAVSQSVGDKVTILGTTGTYGHIIQFTNTATVTEATTSNYNNTPAATVITSVPDYTEGYHLSTYVEFEGVLTKSSNTYLISVGGSEVQISYPTDAQGTALTALDGKTVLVKGYFSGINSSSKFTVMLESVEEVVSTEPSITVNPATANLAASDVEGTLPITYQNLTISDMTDFDIEFCNADEKVADQPSWVEEVLVAEQDPSVGDGYVVSFTVNANDGEARTAYFKVYALADDATTLVYSNLVTINQAAPVIDYAELPFAFNGGKSAIETTVGLTQEGLGSDYSSAPKLKFDGTGDCLILKFNEVPGILSFDIKGNGFSDGTFKVQTSADGETYTDLATYTELSSTQNESFNVPTNARYIKWVYTEKVNGNVALGNIVLAAYTPPQSIEFTATLGDGAYWATFYNGSAAYTLSEGAQAFTMNNSKQLYRLGTDGTVIPENTAVVIISDVPTVILTKTADAGTVTVNGGGNILQGSNAPVAKTGTQYVLGKVGDKIGFYKFNGTSIPAFKAYYVNE